MKTPASGMTALQSAKQELRAAKAACDIACTNFVRKTMRLQAAKTWVATEEERIKRNRTK